MLESSGVYVWCGVGVGAEGWGNAKWMDTVGRKKGFFQGSQPSSSGIFVLTMGGVVVNPFGRHGPKSGQRSAVGLSVGCPGQRSCRWLSG